MFIKQRKFREFYYEQHFGPTRGSAAHRSMLGRKYLKDDLLAFARMQGCAVHEGLTKPQIAELLMQHAHAGRPYRDVSIEELADELLKEAFRQP